MTKNSDDISIVIPTINSSGYIEKNILELLDFMYHNFNNFMIIVVNDCSEDDTLNKLITIKQKHANLKIINLKKRMHQRIATTIGCAHAESKYVLTLDDDGQFQLTDIKKLYDKIIENKGNVWVVSGYYDFKNKNKKYSLVRNFIFLVFNYLLFPSYKKTKYFSSFKIFDRENLDKINAKNIYHFWDIPNKRIDKIKVTKEQINTIRPSNYNWFNYWKILNHVFIKSILLILFFLLLGLVFISNLLYLKLSIVFIYVLLFFILHRDKYAYKKIKSYEIY
jgi:glycosyltransferase involved in cell wall biosynthesis